ncbi:MAG TPA: SRPBCC domain-containing protein [Hyphomicrobiaceae bacterium]|nr:SRPBCC domain-containing protein [Hyphomicrobiaceae bacterium]
MNSPDMTPHSTQHSTVVFGRVFDAPLARVYAAFSDPAERTRLGSAGRKAVFKLDRMDFRIGGSDDFHFGSRGSPRFRCQSMYLDIVPFARIVTSDVIYEREVRRSVVVTTVELKPAGHRTQVKITAQLVWLDGADEIDDLNIRHASLLDNLGRYLEMPEHRP